MIRLGRIAVIYMTLASPLVAADLPLAKPGLTPFDETFDKVFQSGFRDNASTLKWIRPGIVLTTGAAAGNFDAELTLLGSLADTVPLSGDFYAPSLERVSLTYEKALYDPINLEFSPLSVKEQSQLVRDRSYLVDVKKAAKGETPALMGRVSSAWSKMAEKKLPLESVTEPPSESITLDSALDSFFNRLSTWSAEYHDISSAIVRYNSLTRRGKFKKIRELKVAFETAMLLDGGPAIRFDPPIPKWFTTDDWISVGNVEQRTTFLKHVKIERDWLRPELLSETKRLRSSISAFDLGRNEIAADFILGSKSRGSVLLAPSSFILSTDVDPTGVDVIPYLKIVAIGVDQLDY